MTSVFVSRGRSVRDAAESLRVFFGLSPETVFVEGHSCVARFDSRRSQDGIFHIFTTCLAFQPDGDPRGSRAWGIEEATVEVADTAHLVLRCVERSGPGRLSRRAVTVRLEDMDRPDECGRVVHFYRALRTGNMDPRIVAALEALPLGGLYARALARYPQHHHDLYNHFEMHTVLHMPPDAPEAWPIPLLPGDAAVAASPGEEEPANGWDEGDGERPGVEAVVGHHVAWGAQIHCLRVDGFVTGQFEGGIIEDVRGAELAIYICIGCFCVANTDGAPFPIRLDWQGVLSIVEVTLDDNEPGIRVSYIANDGVFNAFVFHSFHNEEAFEACFHELTMAWAQHHNRLYNVGEVFPVLDPTDLVTIVFHFRELDEGGYGIIAKEDFLRHFAPLNMHTDVADVIYELFDHAAHDTADPVDVVQFSKYLLAMRTLLTGALEDKADLMFRMFDFQGQGWLVKSELLWTLTVMSSRNSPEIREGYSFRDFNKWLFNLMDKNRDGYIDHAEFVNAVAANPLVQQAFKTLGLSPQDDVGCGAHPRRLGTRFVHAGHPHFALCCAVQHGVEICVSRLYGAEANPDLLPSDDYATYTIQADSLLSEGGLDATSALPTPEWAFPLDSKVEIVRMQNEKRYNGKTGSVIGYDLDNVCMVVHVHDANAKRLRPENLSIVRPAIQRDFLIRLPPGADPGLCFQTKPNGLPMVAGVLPGGPADVAGVQSSMVVDRIDGYRMPTRRTILDYLEAWSRGGAAGLRMTLSLPMPDDSGVEVGARVQVQDLIAAAEFNGRQGMVARKDNLHTVAVLLDGESEPVVVRESNLKVVGSFTHRRFMVTLPHVGSPDMGMQFDFENEGVYLKGVVPGGPADRSGIPIRSIITSLNGVEVRQKSDVLHAVRAFAMEGVPCAIVEAVVPVAGRNLHGDGAEDTLEITEHAPAVFAEIRATLGLRDEDYLHSIGLSSAHAGLLTCHLRTLIEVTPGSMKFTTFDERFILMGMTLAKRHRMVDMLQRGYADYLRRTPDTLITKYVGLYTILWKGSPVCFSVSLNAFASPRKEVTQVLRFGPQEVNHGGHALMLSPQARRALRAQLDVDAAYLAENDAHGYTLIVGVHTVRRRMDGGAGVGGGLGGGGTHRAAESRVRAAATTLLGNPCFSRNEVVLSYNVNTLPEPVFSKAHHTALPDPSLRVASNAAKHQAKEALYPRRAGRHTRRYHGATAAAAGGGVGSRDGQYRPLQPSKPNAVVAKAEARWALAVEAQRTERKREERVAARRGAAAAAEAEKKKEAAAAAAAAAEAEAAAQKKKEEEEEAA
eukprot:Rhum_TRINITY_DN14592_c19_g1::Rhum_TRINITY_DN14592_c19_g1_i1::g.100641::m.100641